MTARRRRRRAARRWRAHGSPNPAGETALDARQEQAGEEQQRRRRSGGGGDADHGLGVVLPAAGRTLVGAAEQCERRPGEDQQVGPPVAVPDVPEVELDAVGPAAMRGRGSAPSR